jgi:hypothetical protein
MLYGKYTLTCCFESDAQLPDYKGSTFRGVLGIALKKVVCALKRQDCSICLLKQECLYLQVFEPRLTMDGGKNLRQPEPPSPYVIQPPATTRTFFRKGSVFDFNLLLFGTANGRLPYFIYAINEMGKIGVGKKINGRRGAYRLEAVTAGDAQIYTRENKTLRNITPPEDLQVAPTEAHEGDRTVTITFQTPLRIKHNNHLSPELPYHVLVRAMLRRAASLLAQYDGAEPDLDYKGMIQRAQAVCTRHSTLQWVDWSRYSHRQDKAMMMGGLKGSITYTGPLNEYMPLLDFCSRVHLGKQTTFGLGNFTMEVYR